jgi:hypothetical protein
MSAVSRRVGAYLTLLFFSLLFLSCREATAPVSPFSSIPFSLSCSEGDRFVFDGWMISEYGYLIPQSKAIYIWNVRGVGLNFEGRANSILFVVSVGSVGGASAVLDSVYLSIDPNGDVYQYGFLSNFAAIVGDHVQPKRWDRIAAFSLGPEMRWEVGTWDSAGAERMYGEIKSRQDLFSVTVNGVQTVFPGYRVNIESASLGVSYSFSSAPSAVLRIEEAPFLFATGSYKELREISAKK